MKKIWILLAILLAGFIYKQWPENLHKKAEREAETWIKSNLGNSSDYKSIEFGSLDSVFISTDTRKYIREHIMPEIDQLKANGEVLQTQIDEYKKTVDSLKPSHIGYENSMNESNYLAFTLAYDNYTKAVRDKESNTNLINICMNSYESLIENKSFCGYKMTHRYETKNRDGVLELHEIIFYFDKTFLSIEDTEEVKFDS